MDGYVYFDELSAKSARHCKDNVDAAEVLSARSCFDGLSANGAVEGNPVANENPCATGSPCRGAPRDDNQAACAFAQSSFNPVSRTNFAHRCRSAWNTRVNSSGGMSTVSVPIVVNRDWMSGDARAVRNSP
jgi:hypothetical protein